MAKEKDSFLLDNELMTTLSIFVESYNDTLPKGFPQASESLLEEFEGAHPRLFKGFERRVNKWSMVKHRKKVLDWLIIRKDS